MSHLLEKAAAKGDLAALQRLLDTGADLEWQHKGTGRTALLAASIAGHSEAVQLLLERGANRDHRCKALGFSALGWAANQGWSAVARILIAHGAALDLPFAELRRTALMNAAQQGHFELVQLLLEAGADPGLLDFQQRNALALARDKGHEPLVQLLTAATVDVPAAPTPEPSLPWPLLLEGQDSGTDPVTQVRAYTLAVHDWEQRGNAPGAPAADSAFWAEPAQLVARFCTSRRRVYQRSAYGWPCCYSPDDQLLAVQALKPGHCAVLIRDPQQRVLCYEHRFLVKQVAGHWRIDSVKRRLAGTQAWARSLL